MVRKALNSVNSNSGGILKNYDFAFVLPGFALAFTLTGFIGLASSEILAVAEEVFEHDLLMPPTSSVAVMELFAMPFESTVIDDVPCPEVMEPALIDQL
jgi:hypothetical protein